MAHAAQSVELASPADRVWQLVGDFNSLHEWHPAVEESRLNRADDEDGDGETQRTLELAGGGEIRERLEDSDDQQMQYRYSILDGPLPVENYVATIRVRADGVNRCTVEWTSDFDPVGVKDAEAVQIIEGIYSAGLENLRKLFGAPAAR